MRLSPVTGESILTLGAMIGFFTMASQGMLTSRADLWMFAGMLLVIAIFYFALLLCRAIFHFMAGSDTFWWEKYKEEHEKHGKK